MAKRYITQLLSQKLGSYLDGLDSTDVKFSVSEAQLQMENVRIKDDALTKLKLPIQIKHGQIRKLDLRVPWLKITSCPVEITLEGVDLLLTPLSSDQWEVPDIFSPEYLSAIVEGFIKSALEKQTTDQQQSYLDTIRLKILDNLIVKIKDIHVRIEHQPVQLKPTEIKQSSFGILLRSLELHTTDAEGRQIFHDRANTNKNIFKLLSIDGFAIYLNPYDATMIHKLPFKVIGKGNHIGTMMLKSIQQYIQYTSTKEGDPLVVDDPNLIYILRPLSLKIQVERQAKQPQMLNVQITLDQFSIQVLYNQLKAILVFARLAQLFQKKYGEQEKVRKYRFLKQPTMNARQKWRFAIECIRRSIKIKKGALTAFNIPNKLLIEIEEEFKPLLAIYFNLPEANRLELVKNTWTQEDQNIFWHAIQSVPSNTLQQWIKDVIKQVQVAKKQQEPEPQQSWMGWLMGFSQQNKDEEDDLDEFFDCDDGETVQDRNTVYQNTSLSVVFEVKELTVLVAKLNNQNKLDGIQMYNKATRFQLTSPNLNLDRFNLNVTFQESGLDLVSIDKVTSKYVECKSTFKKNSHMKLPGMDDSPQLTLEITKGDPSLAKQGIQYDINLQIISVVYKHYEDLIVRAWAISSIQVDEEISSVAKGTLEDLRETTQNRLHELIYKKRNRFVISIQSPVIILPVRGVFESSPVWVIRTGDMLILSEDTRKLNSELQAQQKIIKKISKRKESQVGELDEFEGYRFTLTSTALQYFHQYEFYEKYLVNQSSKTPTKKQDSIMPARRHDFTPQQNTHFQQREPTHSIAQFSVLEDFEIQMLLRLKKKNKVKETNTAKIIVEIQTSPIQINLSVTLYNLLLNLPKIFTISKQKREDFAREIEDYTSIQKAGVQRNAICEGLVKKQNPRSLLWENFYAVLSGKYVYLYKDRDSQELLESFDISNVDVQEQGVQIVVSSQLDPNVRVVFRSVDGQQKVWAAQIEKRTFDIQIEEYQSTGQMDTMIQKRKTIIKKKAQTLADSSNSEQIQMKFTCLVPQLKVMILRLVLMPETRVFAKPLIYQEWVTFAMIGMEMYRVSRELDSQLQIQFKQITLQNDTLPFNIRTLLSQEQSKAQVPPNQIQTSLSVTINQQKQNSPLFEGLLEEINVELSNVNLKFMPDTLNQLIKLLKSTRQQKSHTEDFICQEEFRLYYQQSDSVEENNASQSGSGDDSLQSIAEQPDEEITAVQTQKFFETTCTVNKTQKSKISVQISNVKMAMLHHQYAMELFSLDASSLTIEMCDWYDHSSFDVKMTNLMLNDLTNYPYTRSPRAYFETISKNLQPEPITPNELIKCNSFEMNLQSYDSPRCPLKKQKFGSQLFMKISPFKINYVGEITMRLIDYFQERFISTFVLADPYKNPKKEFEKLQKRKNIPSEKISVQTDFQQPTEITYMDITIQKAEIYARDRPFSSSYILISTPLIKVQSELIRKTGRIFLKPDIPLAIQRYKIEIQTLNFLYGASKKRKDRLSLLKKTFTVKLDFDTVAQSDFIDKIDLKTMDKSSHISIKIDPVMLVLPQAVYTYILRCSDLNFAWTDRMQSDFYFIKWRHISDHYKQLRKVASQKLQIEISMLSLTLKHSDGSYISELLLSGFDLFMLKFMDGASNMDIKCNRFFILDQKDSNSENVNSKQAVVCPTFSPMVVNLETEMQDVAEDHNQNNHDAQLVVLMKMRPSGRKSIIVTIQGLKIFVKLPLFILLQNFFGQAFPQYNENDIDKPVGFVGNDPDITGCMHLDVNIHKSLICLLNRPGLKSIAFQGDIKFETRSENISLVKAEFNNLSSQTLTNDQRKQSKSFVSQEKANSPVVYSVLLEVTGLTPYICSLSYLDQGDVDFSQINKRQLHNPLNLSMDQKYILTPELNEQSEETGKFGVTIQNVINVKKLMLKLSILDLHLIMQAAAFMSEQMAEETVSRLRHIEQSIDRDFIQNQQQHDQVNQDDDVPPLEEHKDGFRNMLSPKEPRQTLPKRETLTGEQRQQANGQKQMMFEGMLDRFRESNDDNMSTVMLRLSQTTSQFQRLSKGYTSQSYQERGTFLQFIKKDILMQPDEADDHIVQDEGPLQKFTGKTVGLITEIEEMSSGSEESKNEEEQKATTQGESSLTLMQKNMRSESLLGGKGVSNLYNSNSIGQKSKSPIHSSAKNRPETGQLSKFGGSSQLLSGNTSIRQISRATPKGSIKSGRLTPTYRSVHDQSDNEDDFKSALDSLDGYRDAVEEALDVFYSFHEKRPLPKTNQDDDTNEDDFQDVIVQPVNLREETGKETEDEATLSFSESLLRQMQKTELAKKEEQVQKSSLQNILNDVKDVRCELISVLAINDFNSGFTPVLQLEMSSILMNQNWVLENTDTAVELPAVLINYYNLELGEWEPLLERTQINFQQTTSKTDSVISINFKESICLNSTEQCLKNLFHTYKSWMQTPQFFQNSKNSKTLANHNSYSQITSERIKHSLNSDDEDDINEVQNRQIYNSIRESIMVKRDPLASSRLNKRDQMHRAIDVEIDYVGNQEALTKKTGGELVTPFSIVNYTTRTIKIVRGGIQIGTGQFSEVKQFSSQLPNDLTENEKIYVLAPRQSTDYAVTYDRLMGVQKVAHPGQDQPPDLIEDGEMDSQSNNVRESLNTEQEEENMKDKLRKLKNNEIVGIQLSELDFVPSFDLNKNTGQNPWVHEISTFSNESVIKSFVQTNKVDLEQPLLPDEQGDQEEDLDTWEQRKIRNRVFYGTLIKDMRKFLIVRAPYCLVNKSSLNFEVKIIETLKKSVRSKFRVQKGEIMGLDQQFYRNHSIQVRIAREGHQSSRISSDSTEGWSDSVQISVLLNLQLNEGTGVYLTTFDGQSYCTCIKRQQGQLNGTADLVLLPVITINNCLPSCIQIRPYQQKASQRATQISEEPIKPLYTEIYLLEQSQEKQFYTFSPTKYKDDRQVIMIEVLVQGFDWAPIELHVDNYAQAEERDFEIGDLNGNSVKIGLRIQYAKAGFHLVFYAHACLLVESVLALPMMKICYKGGNFRQMKPLANSDEMVFRKYLLCNKDSDVVVGIMDVQGQARPTYSFSPPLDIKQAGKQINFKVVTQGSPDDESDTRYDFVCTPTLQLAHYQESIYTKLVLISPRYVVVNKTKGFLRIAQHTAEDFTAESEQIFTPGEKREWFWPNGELPESQLKIIIKKLQSRVQINANAKGENQIEKLLQLQQFGQARTDDRRLSESDKVLNWNWSAPISLSNENQQSFPIVQSEQGGLRKKIFIIGRKLVGSTTFITIREEKLTDFPTYIIQNRCTNLRLGFSQDGQQDIIPWHLEEMQQVSYAHVDPLALVRTLTFHLTIDKEVKKSRFRQQNCFERVLEKIDLDTEEAHVIEYTDLDAKPHQIEVKLTNDGQTKTLSFSLVGLKVLNTEEVANQRKQQLQSPSQAVSDTLLKSLMIVTINQFCFSLIGYTKRNLYDKIQDNYRPVRERNEIALFTIQGLQLTQVSKNQNSEQEIKLVIDRFQVDNQSSQNPLFQTIFKKKNNSPEVKFLTIDLKRFITKDSATSYIEHFKMELAKCTLKFDDEFLVNFSQAVAAASQTNEDNSSGVHPLFMKENFYEQFDKIDLYLSTQQMDIEPDKSQTFVTAAVTERSQRRQTLKPTQFGVYIIDEVRCPQQGSQIPTAFRHWVMQDQIMEDSSKIYLKKFEISTISFDLSFVFKTKKGEKQELSGPMNYLQSTGLTLVSIDEADFTLNAYKAQKKYIGQQDFMTELTVYFGAQALSEATKLPFSVGVIGSPRNLLKYAQIGITDFVELPRRGFERSWYSGIGGVALGSISMLKNFSIGTFQFTQGVTHGFSNLCVLAVTDKDYAIKREDEHLTQKPQNFVEGVGYGAKSFLYSFYSAAIGVFTRPVIETRRLKSTYGFGKGVWQATTGLIGKPFSGTLDFFSKSSEGIKNTFRIFENYDEKKGTRIRQPRTLYSHQRQIKTFSEDDAFMVSNVLCTIKNGAFINDHYIDMRLIRTANENQTPHFLLWTEENLFLIEATQKALVWHIESKNIENVTNLNNGLMIYLDAKQDYAGRAQVGLPLDSKHQVDIRQWLDQIKTSNT